MFNRWDFFQLTGNDGNDEYLYIIYLNISDWFAYPELLLYTKGCKKKDNQIKYSNPINKKEKNRIYKFIAFAFLDLIAKSMYFVNYKVIGNIGMESEKLAKDAIIFFGIVFRFFFYIIFIENYCNHNRKICSIVSILIILGLLVITDVIHMYYSEETDYNKMFEYFGILFPRCVIYPFIDTLVNKMMDNQSLSPLQYMRWRGFFESILLIIITPILVKTSIFYFSSSFFGIKFWLTTSGYIIINFFKSYLLLHVISKYTAQSVSFLIISESFAGSITEIIKNKDNLDEVKNIIISLFEIILIIFIGVVTLIYEEVLVINRCGLDSDLKKDIIDRERKDYSDAKISILNQSKEEEE